MNGEVELEEQLALGRWVLGRVPVEHLLKELPRRQPLGGFVDVGHFEVRCEK